MELEVYRYSSGREATLGLLSDVTDSSSPRFLCYTLEDQRQTHKVYGETRIPAGRYEVTLRTEGGKHQAYKSRYGAWHKGMLWIRRVPGFKWILIHVGNTDEDTEGCLLVGNSAIQNITAEGSIGSSRAAYARIYPQIAAKIQAGEPVFITYVDAG